MNFINTNARSLGKKIISLADCFEEKGLTLCTLTETWFKTNDELPQLLENLENEHGITAVLRNRPSRAANGVQYGGVAIMARKSTCTLTEFKLTNPEGYEIVAAVAKIRKIKARFFIIAAYLPPNITAARANDCVNFLSDLITEAKRKYEDCNIILAGDFNQWAVDAVLEEHAQVKEIDHGPTRNNRNIDRTFVNFSRSLNEYHTLEPLEDESGRKSDHRMAFFSAVFAKTKAKTVSYRYRYFSRKGAKGFRKWIGEQTWADVLAANTPSDKAIKLHDLLTLALDQFFPYKTTVRRESDPPWINPRIRALIRKRRGVYDRQGRSRKWKDLKAKSDKLIFDRARQYMETQKQSLLAPDASRAFFKNVRAYKCRDKPQQFDLADLFPGEADEEIAEKLSEHFITISREFDGLSHEDIPTAESRRIPELTAAQVAKRLKAFRKPKTMVNGDIFPALVNEVADDLAKPLADIYNAVSDTKQWPQAWKFEYVTAIPKSSAPSSLNDLRNISCTTLFSKIYETFVLEWLGEKVSLRSNQFGGVKGASTEHYLVELWQEVLENLEDPRAGSLLTSIDYSKAFNRLDFGHCLRCLKNKGASSELIAIIASFLSYRQMVVKVGNAMSQPKLVLGGVPQGSILGVFLFNVSIDAFETASCDIKEYHCASSEPPLHRNASYVIGDSQLPADYEFAADNRKITPWVSKLIQALKYVDDNILNEKLNFQTAVDLGRNRKLKHAVRTQNAFRRIVKEAISRGMKVNAAKTNLMVVSDGTYEALASIVDEDGNVLKSSKEMKILGFHFSNKPNMNAQVAAIRKKMTARTWILTHLGHRGFSEEELVKVYKSCILPIHDYCSNVYHSSLTQMQVQQLERQQARALKAIFGYEHSYRSPLQKTGLETLFDRRARRAEAFARKAAVGKLRHWFPRREAPRSTRQTTSYHESFARCQRLRNSPIHYMRRLLNGRES